LAGVNRLAWPRFLVANALGGLVWATSVGLAAYTLGRGIHHIQGPLGVIGTAIAIGVIAGLFVYLRRHEAELETEAQAALPGPVAGFCPRAKVKKFYR
jgi:membrane protein DedA with SNARE-associated domain